MDTDQAIPTILNCDAFKAYLHRSAPLLPDDPPKKVPSSSQGFNEAWRLYLQNKLEGTPQLHFASSDGTDPFRHLQRRNIAWLLFHSVVSRFGTVLNQTHSNIEWTLIAKDLKDESLADELRNLYRHIAPIVKLWLSDLGIQTTRFEFARTVMTLPGAYHHDPREGPLMKVLEPSFDIVDLVDSKLREIGKLLPDPFRLGSEDLLLLQCPSKNLHSHKAVQEYVHAVALSEKVRRVARLFPSNLAHALANITQWVLMQTPECADTLNLRSMMIKLLQDISNELHEADCPSYMFWANDADGPRLEQQMKHLTDGSEASIHKLSFDNRQVVVRKLLVPANQSESSAWLMHKRYKRAMINHWQMEHPNIIKLLGLIRLADDTSSDEPGAPARFFLCMVSPLYPATLGQRKFLLDGGEEEWLPLAHLMSGIVAGISYLHRHETVHGDLHPDNILIDHSQSAKICDFGISRIQHRLDNSTSTRPYSTHKMLISTPEADELQQEEDRDAKPQMPHDVFACGVVFLCLAILPERERTHVNNCDIYNQAKEMVKDFKSVSVTSSGVPKPEPCTYLRLELGSLIWRLIQSMTAYEADHRPLMGKVAETLDNIFAPLPPWVTSAAGRQ